MNSSVQCFYCQEFGHFQRNCPYKPPANNNTGQAQQYDSAPNRHNVRAASTGTSNMDKVYLNVKIRGRSQACLLDSGCEVTVIPSRLVDKHRIRRSSKNLLAANGTKIPVLGYSTLKAYIGDTPLEITGLVCEHVATIMLGVDFLHDYEIQWNFATAEVTIGGRVFKLRSRRERSDKWCRRVVVAEESTVPPKKRQVVSACRRRRREYGTTLLGGDHPSESHL